MLRNNKKGVSTRKSNSALTCVRVLIRLMDCIEEEKADEKSGEEIKRERMTDEKREKKRE